MSVVPFRTQKSLLYARFAVVYGLTIAFAWYAVQPAPSTGTMALVSAQQQLQSPNAPEAIAGKPNKLIIKDSGVEVPVTDGFYDPKARSWTLKEHQAHFARLSTLANDHTGTTFIYGHNTNDVFGALRNQPPVIGSLAQVYTDNGHIFEYKLRETLHIKPNEAVDLPRSGKPQLKIQTCTGSVDEWRTTFKYDFVRVVK